MSLLNVYLFTVRSDFHKIPSTYLSLILNKIITCTDLFLFTQRSFDSDSNSNNNYNKNINNNTAIININKY